LPAREPGAPLSLTVRSGAETQTLTDLLIGDVWLCSGQSNMELPVRRAMGGEYEVAAAADPNIRLLQTGRVSLPAPTSALPKEAVWQVASPPRRQLRRRLFLHGPRHQEDHRRSGRPDRRHLGRFGDPGLDQPRGPDRAEDL
jgi:hypothetical protein